MQITDEIGHRHEVDGSAPSSGEDRVIRGSELLKPRFGVGDVVALKSASEPRMTVYQTRGDGLVETRWFNDANELQRDAFSPEELLKQVDAESDVVLGEDPKSATARLAEQSASPLTMPPGPSYEDAISAMRGAKDGEDLARRMDEILARQAEVNVLRPASIQCYPDGVPVTGEPRG